MYKVYGKPNCKFCDMAKALLEMNGQEFEYIDVTQDEEAMAHMRAQGFRTVPQVYKDGELIGGFDQLKTTF